MQQTPDTSQIDSSKVKITKDTIRPDSAIQTVVIDSSIVEHGKNSLPSKKVPVEVEAPLLGLKSKNILNKNISTETDSLILLKDSLYKDSINTAIAIFREKLEHGYHQSEEVKAYYKGEPKDNYKNWSFFVLLFCLLLLAISKAKYSKRFNLLLKSIWSWKFAKQIIRYEKVYSHPTNISLLLIFVLSISLFIQKAFLTRFFNTNMEIQLFFFLCIGIVAVYFVKILALTLVGKIFEIDNLTEEYIFHILLFFKFTGVILLPITIIYLFSNTGTTVSLWLGISIILVLYLVRLIRRVLIGLQANENLYSIILYLCTLEILPVLVIGKFFNDLLFS